MFSKDSFDELPQRKKWDHAIDFKSGAPTNRLQGLSIGMRRTEGTRCVPKREPGIRTNPRIKISDGIAILLQAKERWEIVTHTRLLQTE